MVSHCGLVFISVMINDVEHLFMCLLTIGMPSLVKCLFRLLPIFKIGFFIFFLMSFENPFIFWIQVL